MSMHQPLPRQTLFAGRYRVDRCLAWGGTGAVYEVVHVETDRRHALKVMLPEVLGSADQLARFKREAKIGAGIESEHVVQIFDAGIDEVTRMPFLVMEMLQGEDLSKRLKRLKRFAPADVVTYLSQAALALDEIHQASIVHRDLKPDNLFLTERKDGSPRIKVLDFGIAKLIDSAAGAITTQALGTPLYMAPEQFQRDGSLSPATDIYALGMLTFTLLAGVPYWREEMVRGRDVYAFVTLAMKGPQEPATLRAARLGVTLPPAFDAWFARATALLPDQRFPSATAAMSALRTVFEAPPAPAWVAQASAEPIQPSPWAAPKPLVPRPKPRRRVSVGLVIAAIAIASALGLFAMSRPAARPSFKPAAQIEALAGLYGEPITPVNDEKK